MVGSGQAAVSGIQGLDLWQISRQDSAGNTYTVEHDTAQRRIGFIGNY